MENLHIVDSYKVSKWQMRGYLNDTRKKYNISRTNFSMILEWATHNLLYSLHICRNRTKDVDLEYPQKWYYKVGYFFTGLLALMIIK